MPTQPTLSINSNGGYFECGTAFLQSKWKSILDTYYRLLEKDGKCSIRTLAKEALISTSSAQKIIKLQQIGMNSVPVSKKGHGRSGTGSLLGLTIEHHLYIYELYKMNPSMPLYGYSEELWKEFGIQVSDAFIKKWFDTVGPKKGSLRVTSHHNIGRYSMTNLQKLQEYLTFIASLDDHTKLVFSDEKPMKEINIFPRVRRDPFTGEIPKNKASSTCKNRYNILAAVNIKGGDVPPVYYEVVDATTNAAIYCQFVRKLIEHGVLERGDVFVVDNCTVHNQGDNTGLPYALWDLHGIHFVNLPPYSPEFNPTELVFNCLTQRIKSERARYNAIDAADFKDAIEMEMDSFDLLDVVKFYKHMGYLK